MRRRLITFLLAATLAAVALPAGMVGAHGDGGAGPAVLVKPASGDPVRVPLADLGSPEIDSEYTVRDSGGGQAQRRIEGWPLNRAIVESGIDPFNYSYLEVKVPSGGEIVLSNHQVRSDGAFPDGPPAIFETGGATTGFLRPLSGDDDANAGDEISGADPLVIKLRLGSLISVNATASKTEVDPGEEVSFEASVTRAGSGQSLDYRWSFDDGTPRRTGSTVTHTFKRPGSYDVLVGVTAPGDSTGGTDVVTIEVGEPKKGGPDRKGGGSNEDDDAPDSGQATGSANGGDGGDGGGGSPGAATGAPPAASGGPAANKPERDRADRKDRKPDRREPDTASGEQVAGQLLDGEVKELTPDPEQQQGDDPDAPVARTGELRGDGFGITGTAALAGSLLLLFGLGIVSEGSRLASGRLLEKLRGIRGRS